MTLEKYSKKRNFNKTDEPKPKVQSSKNKKIFVVQFHKARANHYDFRLEHNGVLLSWAVPKGLSLNPIVKRLAVMVEDHPLEYAKFKGVIPKGNYGAGVVEIFDSGYYKHDGDFQQGLKNGRLKFTLFGRLFKGRWTLVRTEGENWLIIKEKDEHIKNEELNNPAQKNPFSQINPMLALNSSVIPKGKNWLFEIKYDGYRIIAFVQNDKTKLVSRNNVDFTKKFTNISSSLETLAKQTSMVLDGEVVCFDKNGKSDFGLLQTAIKKRSQNLHYVVFDVIAFNGEDLREIPLIKRKELLENILKGCPKNIVYSSHIVGSGKETFEFAKQKGLEGIVAKKSDSAYSENRNGDWVKIKCYKRQEFVIGGYCINENDPYLSSILVGYYKNNQLIYAGSVGTGISDLDKQELLKKFKKLIQTAPTFNNFNSKKRVKWLKPKLVCEIQFAEITKNNSIRQPVFIGLRTDKEAKNVFLEVESE